MIKLAPVKGTDTVKITFSLSLDTAAEPVSVVGDFNGWDPHAHPLKKRSNGTRSVTVEAPANAEYRFKYLADGGGWFCEPDAERAGDDSLLRV
jgi:1,4-alpha-glucan branching enzyme